VRRCFDRWSGLAADTFAHGRLANPPHPLWHHFESFHILQQPTYASKYPPGQGLLLALGQVLGGAPIVGAWIGAALLVVAVGWALRAWVPARWALGGALLTATHATTVQWGQSFWGGAVAATGGALVIGALGRSMAHRRMADAGTPTHNGWWLGLGLSLMAVSRPYEGAVFGLASLAVVWRFHWRAVLGPVLLCVAATVGWLGYYNWRVTGNGWRLPYAAYQEQYGSAPVFLWQHRLSPRHYAHGTFAEFYAGNEEQADYRQQQSLGGFLGGAADKVRRLVAAVLPSRIWYGDGGIRRWAAVGVFVAGLALVWSRRTWRLLIVGLIFLAGLLVEMWCFPHYAAPALVLVVAAAVEALRRIGSFRWRGRRVGRLPARMVVLLCLLLPVVVARTPVLLDHVWAAERERVETNLMQSGRHLVFVRYGAGHSPHAEWVYNRADLSRAPVVWARETDPARNRQLIESFPDRQVWLLEPDASEVRLSPYAAGQDLILGAERPAGQ
jgi:hypothetical protein